MKITVCYQMRTKSLRI